MEHIERFLSDYIDGEVSDLERARIDEHLASCPECRAGLAAMRSVSGLVSSLPKKPLPAGFRERLLRRGLREPFPEPPRAWAIAAFSAAGLLAMVAVFREVRYRAVPLSSEGEGGYNLPAADLTPPERKSYWRKDVKARGGPVEGRASRVVASPMASPAAVLSSNAEQAEFLAKERDRIGIREFVPKAKPGAAGSFPPDRPLNKAEAMAVVRQMTSELSQINRMRQERAAPVVPLGKGDKPAIIASPDRSRPLEEEPPEAGKKSMESADSIAMVQGGALAGAKAPLPETEAPSNIPHKTVRARRESPPLPRFKESTSEFRWAKSWKGNAAGLSPGGTQAKNPEDWASLWKRLGQGGPAPEVDFSIQMAIAAFSGPGGEVEIQSIRAVGPTLWVNVRSVPKPGAAPSFHLVLVERSDLPAAFEGKK